MLKLVSVVPFHCSNIAIPHVFYSLCQRWQGPDLYAHMIVPSCEAILRQPRMTEAVSPFLRWYYYKQGELPRKMAENLFLKKLQQFDVSYIWPGISLKTMQKARNTGKPIFLERVNCFTGLSKQILDEGYIRLGLKPTHKADFESIRSELAEIELADFLLCPSKIVTQSFLQAGVPAYKLLTTSEGWSPERFPYLHESKPIQKHQGSGFTAVFMGSDSIRKGLPTLLRVWEKANIPGKLVILGHLDPLIAELCGDALSRTDVVVLNARPDYASYYLSADVFVLPSLEEGSPLVTYEAMAHGLPVLASPMGAGGIVRNGIDGFVIPPEEEDRWVETLVTLATDHELRHQMGESARQKAYDYTWDKVAVKRANLMLGALNQRAIAC